MVNFKKGDRVEWTGAGDANGKIWHEELVGTQATVTDSDMGVFGTIKTDHPDPRIACAWYPSRWKLVEPKSDSSIIDEIRVLVAKARNQGYIVSPFTIKRERKITETVLDVK